MNFMQKNQGHPRYEHHPQMYAKYLKVKFVEGIFDKKNIAKLSRGIKLHSMKKRSITYILLIEICVLEYWNIKNRTV